jgi:flagellar assembly protein FliH
MTSIAHRYADFGPLGVDGEIAELVPLDRVEDQKLAAFEEGYQAGWTDAEKNHASEQKNISEDFLRTLQDQSSTHQEALSRLNRGLKPMFEQMISVLLPQTVSAALRAHVIEQLTQLAATQTNAQITLRVSESNLLMLEELMEDVELKTPVSITSDPKLSTHQLFVMLDTIEREINLDAVSQEITKAMNAFNFHSQTEQPDA